MVDHFVLLHLIKGRVFHNLFQGFVRHWVSNEIAYLPDFCVDVLLHIFVEDDEDLWVIPLVPPGEVHVEPISVDESLLLVKSEELVPDSTSEVEELDGTVKVVERHKVVLQKTESGFLRSCASHEGHAHFPRRSQLLKKRNKDKRWTSRNRHALWLHWDVFCTEVFQQIYNSQAFNWQWHVKQSQGRSQAPRVQEYALNLFLCCYLQIPQNHDGLGLGLRLEGFLEEMIGQMRLENPARLRLLHQRNSIILAALSLRAHFQKWWPYWQRNFVQFVKISIGKNREQNLLKPCCACKRSKFWKIKNKLFLSFKSFHSPRQVCRAQFLPQMPSMCPPLICAPNAATVKWSIPRWLFWKRFPEPCIASQVIARLQLIA